MKKRIFGNWKTTVLSVLGGILIILGTASPDFDPETNSAIISNVDMILTGTGGLITVLTGIFAKDN